MASLRQSYDAQRAMLDELVDEEGHPRPGANGSVVMALFHHVTWMEIRMDERSRVAIALDKLWAERHDVASPDLRGIN